MVFRLDAQTGQTVPCTVVPSTRVPGKVLLVNVDGSSVVVEPNGTQVRTVPAGDDNWDSPWTQATQIGGFVIYQSANGADPGVCRTYRIIS